MGTPRCARRPHRDGVPRDGLQLLGRTVPTIVHELDGAMRLDVPRFSLQHDDAALRRAAAGKHGLLGYLLAVVDEPVCRVSFRLQPPRVAVGRGYLDLAFSSSSEPFSRSGGPFRSNGRLFRSRVLPLGC